MFRSLILAASIASLGSALQLDTTAGNNWECHNLSSFTYNLPCYADFDEET